CPTGEPTRRGRPEWARPAATCLDTLALRRQTICRSMRPAQHVGERHQEDVLAVLIAHVHGPGAPVIRGAAGDELAHDLLGAFVRLDQILDVTAILIQQHALGAGAMKEDVGHVLLPGRARYEATTPTG